MNKEYILQDTMYFSYDQFMVYDACVKYPGTQWTDTHISQGFARRECVVNFSTLVEFGHAQLSVSADLPPSQFPYERVIAVPFLVKSGRVNFDGPEEDPDQRQIEIAIGNYRLWCAQRMLHEESEQILLVFEKVASALERSTIVQSDSQLSPPSELLETSEKA